MAKNSQQTNEGQERIVSDMGEETEEIETEDEGSSDETNNENEGNEAENSEEPGSKIHPDFTEELQKEWEDRGFNYESCKGKQLIPKQVRGNEQQLREEYNNTFISAQEWLENNYPDKKTQKIYLNQQLEGVLDCSGYKGLYQIFISNQVDSSRLEIKGGSCYEEETKIIPCIPAQTWLDKNCPKNGTCIIEKDEYGEKYDNFGKTRGEIEKLDIGGQAKENEEEFRDLSDKYEYFGTCPECQQPNASGEHIANGGFGKVEKARLRGGTIVGDKEGNYIMVMEFMNEGNLREYLKKNYQKLDFKDDYKCPKLYFLQQITQGLKDIHRKKLVHRDFHSGNIIIDEENKGSEYETITYGEPNNRPDMIEKPKTTTKPYPMKSNTPLTNLMKSDTMLFLIGQEFNEIGTQTDDNDTSKK
ncbi:1693_t:CDS:2 [Scutellospora calospora]|uniref:1693_t:CDS:1 n=1 Tax=Scutellospora calospora TaxID=85575 RepID=A0ACA9LKJ6_9GLOM|nr:1693_t:CDS:2 [Scutellospora calospora]